MAAPATDTADLKGRVFNIERFCVHDGPGIRTLVFLKGCPLSCRWCANPEGMASEPRVAFLAEKCIGCGSCVEACPEHAAVRVTGGAIATAVEHCINCGRCAAVCPARARLVYGKSQTVGEVFDEIYRDLPFYRRSKGGVTVSGGEPLMQSRFTRSLLERCASQNIHTAVETCGHAPWETVNDTLRFADLVLFDFKHIHPLKHLKFTGQNNTKILGNLKRLDASGKALILRVPVIPGFNATPEEMRAMAGFAARLNSPHPCHLLPYHGLGNYKYRHLGLKPRFKPVKEPSPEQMQAFSEIWQNCGLEIQIGG